MQNVLLNSMQGVYNLIELSSTHSN